MNKYFQKFIFFLLSFFKGTSNRDVYFHCNTKEKGGNGMGLRKEGGREEERGAERGERGGE